MRFYPRSTDEAYEQDSMSSLPSEFFQGQVQQNHFISASAWLFHTQID